MVHTLRKLQKWSDEWPHWEFNETHNAALQRLLRDYAALEAENEEQARLLGMSGDRELDLMSEIDRLKRDVRYWMALDMVYFICDDLLPSFGITLELGRINPELHASVHAALKAAQEAKP